MQKTQNTLVALAVFTLSVFTLTGLSKVTFAKTAQPANTMVFLADLPDFPVMEGLKVVDSGGLNFNTPSVRVNVTLLQGAIPPVEVREFYRETLPQLGWLPENLSKNPLFTLDAQAADPTKDVYVRDVERLILEFQPSKSMANTELQVELQPIDN